MPPNEPPMITAEANNGQSVPSLAIAVCLFGLSFGTVIFALGLFRLVSFFIMPALFFDLLFIAFPVGAFVGARFFAARLDSFVRTLWLLLIAMAASALMILFAKHFAYMRAHFTDVEVPKLLGQIAVFTGLLLPFFAAYGLSEYVGYRVGRRYLGGQMRLVYGLCLFGAAAAYVASTVLPSWIGMAKTLAMGFGCVGVAVVLVGRQSKRILGAGVVVLVLFCLALPQLERHFLSLYKGRETLSTWEYQTQRNCDLVFQKWGRYSLCEIVRSPDHRTYYGFYNDFFQWEYTLPDGFAWAALGAFPLQMVDPDSSRILIVGVGGGRQVRFARRLGIRDIVAIEIEPTVLEAVRSPRYLCDEFDRVYEDPQVRLIRAEGRAFVESTSESFDLIYLPSVGGYPQMMLEPGNMIRTREAYQTMMDRLTDNGFLAIWYPWGLDKGGVLTSQYVRTLRDLGYKTQAYSNEYEYLILSCRSQQTSLPTPEQISNAVLTYPWMQTVNEAESRHVSAKEYFVHDDPWYRPVTDNKPFLGGNIRNIVPIGKVFELLGFGAAILLIAGVLTLIALRRRGDPGITGRSYWSVAALAFLLGANFLLMEHYVVLAVFQRNYVYYDSLMVGAIGFLVLTGMGSLITRGRLRPIVIAVAMAAMIVLLVSADRLPATAVVALIAPMALATGSFFPALFDLAARNPLAVFALDAIGAGFGAITASLVPITFGFEAFLFLAGAVFLITAVANVLFHHRLPRVGA